jgi:hypothetical protein
MRTKTPKKQPALKQALDAKAAMPIPPVTLAKAVATQPMKQIRKGKK